MNSETRVDWQPLIRFVKSVSTLASATAVGQLIVLLATPLLTRLYSPSEFGNFAVFYAVTSTVLVGSSLRYELAIPLPKAQTKASQIMALALVLNGLIAMLTFVLIVPFKERFANLIGAPDLEHYLWLAPVLVFAAGTYKVFSYWSIRAENYGLIGKTKIIQGFAGAASQLVAGFASFGVLGLIVGYLVGQCAGVTILVREAGRDWRPRIRQAFGRESLALAKRYHRFPLYDVPASVVDSLSTQLPAIMFATIFSPAVAGFYMLSQRVLSVPMGLVGQAVGQVLLGGARTASADGQLGDQVPKVIGGLASVIVLPSIVVFFFGENLFVFIFGADWHNAGAYASWMILGIAVQFLYSPISLLLVATNGQHLNLLIHLALLVGKTAAIVYGGFLESPLIAIKSFSLVGAFGYAVAVMIVVVHTRHHQVSS